MRDEARVRENRTETKKTTTKRLALTRQTGLPRWRAHSKRDR